MPDPPSFCVKSANRDYPRLPAISCNPQHAETNHFQRFWRRFPCRNDADEQERTGVAERGGGWKALPGHPPPQPFSFYPPVRHSFSEGGSSFLQFPTAKCQRTRAPACPAIVFDGDDPSISPFSLQHFPNYTMFRW